MNPIIPASLRPPGFDRRLSEGEPHRPLIFFEGGITFEDGIALGALVAFLACLLLTLIGDIGDVQWPLTVAFGAVVVGMARAAAQWINSRDDPRHANRPPDAP